MLNIFVLVVMYVMSGLLVNEYSYRRFKRMMRDGLVLAGDEKGPSLERAVFFVAVVITAMVVLIVLSLLFYFDITLPLGMYLHGVVGLVAGALVVGFAWAKHEKRQKVDVKD